MRNVHVGVRQGASAFESWIAAQQANAQRHLEDAERRLEAERQKAVRQAQALARTVVTQAERVVDAAARRLTPVAPAPPPRPAARAPQPARSSPPTRAAARDGDLLDGAGAQMGVALRGAQDALNGGVNAQTATEGREAAAAAAIIGGLTGGMATNYSDSMSRISKEVAGESASKVRNLVRGHKTEGGRKRKEDLPLGGYTIPDMRSYRNGEVHEVIESKFGRFARLSKRQAEAYAQLKNYRVDHILPQDVGAAVGLPVALVFPWDPAKADKSSVWEGTAP